MKKYFILYCVATFQLSLIAQDSTQTILDGFLQNSRYCRPFVSEIHSSLSKVELGYNKSYAEFDLLEEKSRFSRPVVELHVGFEAPLFAFGYGSNSSNKNWGFGMRLPLSVHCLEDMWGPETAPVINTDYRFGGPRLIAIRNISESGFLKNISFSWLTIFHECTHLGDEIVIYRMQENFAITRINVSYEYTEFQVTLNDPEKTNDNYHSFKLGMQYRISNRGLGWFSVRKNIEVADTLDIEASKIRGEYYIEYQFQRTRGFLASKRFVNIISFETRYRVRYGYPLFQINNGVRETKSVKEAMSLNFNLYLGYKFYPKNNDKQSLGLFFHAYRGLNPYGQLRNYPGYPFFGLSLTYEP
jgi:hypothetical protein